MAYRFDFDSRQRILRAIFTGDLSDDEIFEFYRRAAECVALTDPLGALVDFSAIQHCNVGIEAVRRLAKLKPTIPQPERPRVIVAPSDRSFGVARVFEFEGEGTRPNVHVVRNLAQAWAILGMAVGGSFVPLEEFNPPAAGHAR